jgi:hypothetical protein
MAGRLQIAFVFEIFGSIYKKNRVSMSRLKKIMMMPLPAAMTSAPMQPLQPRVYCNYARLPQAMTATGPPLPWTPHPHGMSPQHPLQMPAGGHGLQPHPLNSGVRPQFVTEPIKDPRTHQVTPISENPLAGICMYRGIGAYFFILLVCIGIGIAITVAVVGLPSSFSILAKIGVFIAVLFGYSLVLSLGIFIFYWK